MCAATVDIAAAMSWKCPNANDDDRHHALRLTQSIAPLRGVRHSNPFVAYLPYLAWTSYASRHHVDELACQSLINQVTENVVAIDGTGFRITPFERADQLSDALGFSADGGVWIKDETGQVAGSHKPRHLMTILLHLLTTESLGLAPWTDLADRPSLAIASCGNAAYAAATLAAAVQWPITVFVPPAGNPVVVARLRALGAQVVECSRRSADPAGDPCIHRFREAVAQGAIPFTVQGTENAWCLDGGRTIGWEMAREFEERIVGPPLDRLFVQVGAGSFAASCIDGFRMSGLTPRLHPVQTTSCAPLSRAWANTMRLGGPSVAAGRWSECMWPWQPVGDSAADGILDDETYDWLPVVQAMWDANGSPVVATEPLILQANELGCRTTGINASHTGTAGLAGLLAVRDQVDSDERVAVVFSGVRRAAILG